MCKCRKVIDQAMDGRPSEQGGESAATEAHLHACRVCMCLFLREGKRGRRRARAMRASVLSSPEVVVMV